MPNKKNSKASPAGNNEERSSAPHELLPEQLELNKNKANMGTQSAGSPSNLVDQSTQTPDSLSDSVDQSAETKFAGSMANLVDHSTQTPDSLSDSVDQSAETKFAGSMANLVDHSTQTPDSPSDLVDQSAETKFAGSMANLVDHSTQTPDSPSARDQSTQMPGSLSPARNSDDSIPVRVIQMLSALDSVMAENVVGDANPENQKDSALVDLTGNPTAVAEIQPEKI